jgi:hypothetical protein
MTTLVNNKEFIANNKEGLVIRGMKIWRTMSWIQITITSNNI